jgi:hypothetical protein
LAEWTSGNREMRLTSYILTASSTLPRWLLQLGGRMRLIPLSQVDQNVV